MWERRLDEVSEDLFDPEGGVDGGVGDKPRQPRAATLPILSCSDDQQTATPICKGCDVDSKFPARRPLGESNHFLELNELTFLNTNQSFEIFGSDLL